MILDGCAFGYYTQCLALTRHLFDNWMMLAYLELEPSASRRLVLGAEDSDPAQIDRKVINTKLRATGNRLGRLSD